MKHFVNTNVDEKVAAGFGDEWSRFDQTELLPADKQRIFEEYFAIFPREHLRNAVGADFGCGSGRWATLVAPQVKHLICIDASREALEVARRNLREFDNCSFLHTTIDDVEIDDCSLDFAYSLGVLHHIPDTARALRSCVRRLKPGAPMLVYLYYRFDNRSTWYRMLWWISNLLRMAICRLPNTLRFGVTQLIAVAMYWPLARSCRVLRKLGFELRSWPLQYYSDKSFYVMRTDALDRFGTRLEHRYTRAEILTMLHAAGLKDIRFSESAPYWCAVGYRTVDV